MEELSVRKTIWSYLNGLIMSLALSAKYPALHYISCYLIKILIQLLQIFTWTTWSSASASTHS